MEPVWRRSAQYTRVQYHRVEIGSFRLLTKRSEWPEPLRWVFDVWDASPTSDGRESLYTPRFIVARESDRSLLFTAAGEYAWRYEIVPFLNRLVGA